MRTKHEVDAERRQVWAQAHDICKAARKARRELTWAEQDQVDDLLERIDALDDERQNIDNQVARALVRPEGDRRMNPMNDLNDFLRNGTGVRRIQYVAGNQRSLVVGTDGAGGYTVPRDVQPDIWRMLEDPVPMLRFGRVIPTNGARTLDIPVVANFGTAVAVSEGSAIAGTDPAFNIVTLGDHKVGQVVQVSRELLADTAVDITGFVQEALAENIAGVIGPWITEGTGTTEPTGYQHAVGTYVTGGTGLAGKPTFDNLIDVFGALPAKHRRESAWLVSDSALVAMRGLKDTTGQPLWAPASASAPETFLGRPVITDPYLPAVGTAVKSIVLCNPQAYAVRVADGGIDLEASREYAFTADLTTFRAVMRMDAAPLDTDAFVAFQGGSA